MNVKRAWVLQFSEEHKGRFPRNDELICMHNHIVCCQLKKGVLYVPLKLIETHAYEKPYLRKLLRTFPFKLINFSKITKTILI